MIHSTLYYLVTFLVKTFFFLCSTQSLNSKYIKILNGGMMLPDEFHKHKVLTYRFWI